MTNGRYKLLNELNESLKREGGSPKMEARRRKGDVFATITVFYSCDDFKGAPSGSI
jgi:hypothetical protein